MSEPTLQELKELIISSRQDLELKLSELDKKLETGLIEVKGEIKRVEGILSAKMDGIDKRLSNEEGITRAVFGGLILAVCAGVILNKSKNLMFNLIA